MVAAMASIPQIIAGCKVVMQIQKQCEKTSKIIESSKKNYQDIESAYIQKTDVIVLKKEEHDAKKVQVDKFFAEQTKLTMEQLQDKTQRAVDGWTSDLIDRFVNDKAISAIDNQFDDMLLKIDGEDEVADDKNAGDDLIEKDEGEKELSLLEEAQDGACEILKTCMDATLNAATEKMLHKGINTLVEICQPIY